MTQRLLTRRRAALSTLTAAATLTACAGSQARPDYVFPSEDAAGASAAAWFAGESRSSEQPGASVEARFVAAEMDFWAGDVERAFDRHAALLRAAPAHPLARFSVTRMHDLHDEVVDFERRARAALEGLTYSDVHPLTATQLALIGQRVAWRSWRRSDSAEPFDASALGLPNRWRTSPTMSTWRLLDFDTPFPPERDARLADGYVAPTIAEDDPTNARETLRWAAGGISLTPRFERSGIHYMETFATVLSNEDQVFWLTGNFAAATRVWIDGVEVLERREGDYGTGKRMRRIKLSPGTHRVLVKMAYQSGYRDWFDVSFLNARATPLSGSRLSFNDAPPTGDVAGGVTVLSAQKLPGDLEIAVARGDQVASSSDMTLYLTALAAYSDRQPELFAPAADRLSERAPKFAPIRSLRAEQIRTLWEVPSEKRDEESLKLLREAHELDPESLRYTLALGQRLRQRGDEREVRALLEAARDAAVTKDDRVRHVMPLNLWAAWLEEKGWGEDAELAWARSVTLAPANCGAARRLQSSYHSRSHYPEPSSYVTPLELCPELHEAWLTAQPDRHDERLALTRRNAARYPFDASAQLSLSRELRKLGQAEESSDVLKLALEWRPDDASIHEELVDRALADRGPETALDLVSRYEALHGPHSWSVFKAASIRGELPLADLMQPGPDVARSIAEAEAAGTAPSAGQGDEAFYAIDFAARRYFPDGSSVSLTHTMVRVMTKGAIDRFGEVSVPGDAQLLRARTVKSDGSTASPERTAGKDTLSMPSLAPGDYVELAYLQFDPAGAISRTRREGTKFFFKMQDISSLHSEYVVIHPDGEFIRRNDAPAAQAFTYDGDPAVRFVRRDSPRPVGEPYAVSVDERLPWVQLHADGLRVDGFTLINRNMRERIADSAKSSPAVDAQLDAWIAAAKGAKGEARLEEIFYAVVSDLPRASGSWTTDLAHGIATRSANPMLALLVTYQRAGLDAHVYSIKSPMADPDLDPMFEASAFNATALRVKVPGEDRHVWLAAGDQDAMFNALGDGQVGQPAVCLTCETPERLDVPNEGIRTPHRDVAIDATLDPGGALTGTLAETFSGPTAAYIRSVLRQRTEETARRKFIEARLAEYVPGANISDYSFVDADDPDAPITISIAFARPEWAKSTNGALRVETPLFREPLGSAYGSLAERSSALMIGYARASTARMTVALPAGAQAKLLSRSGALSLDGPFGDYDRSATIDDGVLTIEAALSQPIQRVPASQYPAFRDWARAVEYSSILALEVASPE